MDLRRLAVLRNLGYVGANFTISANTSRTCRLANATPDRLRELIAANLADQERIFRFNAEHGIKLYRLSSQTIPFASHPCNGIAWWDEFAAELASLREISTQHAFRLSMHPGQYTVLNSPNPNVVVASVAELTAAAKLLDLVHGDPSGKIVLHVGGAYGDKYQAMKRFETVASGLDEVIRRRLVIENDDSVFTTSEVLSLAETIGLPVVFDWFHHQLLPSETGDDASLIQRCCATWGEVDGVPKMHISSQSADGKKGHHSEYIDLFDMCAFLRAIMEAGDPVVDIMVEAKQKDLALFRLRDGLLAAGENPQVASRVCR